MNLLIVDDEYYSAESTRCKLSQHTDCFDEIICAYSMKQALDYFSSHTVAVMICDIEMPGGSGLQLLDHIRERGLDTICIFLTAFAKFEYISTAMKLSSIDYLLKPVDDSQLLSAIDKAIHLYEQRNCAKANEQASSYWHSSRHSLHELFWMDLLSGAISADPKEIAAELRQRNLDSSLQEQEYLLLLIQHVIREPQQLNRQLFEFTLRNICGEYYFLPPEIPVMIRLGHNCYLLPLPADGRSRSFLHEQCAHSFQAYASRYPGSFNYYLAARVCSMEGVAEQVRLLTECARKNVSLENHIFDLAQEQNEQTAASPEFPAVRWAQYLQSRRCDTLGTECSVYLSALQHNGATREALVTFYHSFLHLLLSSLENYFPEALPAFRAQTLSESEEQTVSSFYRIREFAERCLKLYGECAAAAYAQDDAVTLVRRYIREHLAEKMSRESLASMVYLTPDYLSHQFKEATGYSLTNYVIHERVEEAKRLLLQTEMNIWDIAITCGFQNISYFSRQFKNFTGLTPREFRG